MFLVISGAPGTLCRFYGPFETLDAAQTFCAAQPHAQTFIAALEAPEPLPERLPDNPMARVIAEIAALPFADAYPQMCDLVEVDSTLAFGEPLSRWAARNLEAIALDPRCEKFGSAPNRLKNAGEVVRSMEAARLRRERWLASRPPPPDSPPRTPSQEA